MCKYDLCPGTVQIRWDAAVADERRLIAELDANDGSGWLQPAVDAVDYAFRQVQRAGAPKGATRNKAGLDAARRRWLERRSTRGNSALTEQRTAERAKLAEIRERYQQYPRLSIDDVRFLLGKVYDTYDMDADDLASNIERMLRGEDLS